MYGNPGSSTYDVREADPVVRVSGYWHQGHGLEAEILESPLSESGCCYKRKATCKKREAPAIHRFRIVLVFG